jgi:hypothetical protein
MCESYALQSQPKKAGPSGPNCARAHFGGRDDNGGGMRKCENCPVVQKLRIQIVRKNKQPAFVGGQTSGTQAQALSAESRILAQQAAPLQRQGPTQEGAGAPGQARKAAVKLVGELCL